MKQAYLAIDLGAESGRVIAAALDDGRMQLEEIHRFAHEPVWLPTGLHWDITGIWREIVAGLRKAAAWAAQHDVRLVSVGVDTWGVDWALVDKAGELVGLPHAYRDPRNQAAYEQVVAKLGAERIYQTTGIQFMALNTLYSLYAHKLADPGALAAAERLLFMPDLFHYWLSGELAVEATIASTSQMVDCHTGDWAREMLAELGLPAHILQPTVVARHRGRHDPQAAGERHRLAGRFESDRAGVARHGQRDRRGAGGRRTRTGAICRAAPGRCWARSSTRRASRRRRKRRCSPTNWACSARRGS